MRLIVLGWICIASQACAPSPVSRTSSGPTPATSLSAAAPVASVSASCEGRIAVAQADRQRSVPLPRPPGPATSLSRLFPLSDTGSRPKPTVLELGRVEVAVSAPSTLTPADLSYRALPPELVEAELPAAEKASWRQATATRKQLRDAHLRHYAIEQEARSCEESSCPELACLLESKRASAEREIPAARVAVQQARATMIQRLETLEREPGSASKATVQLALARLLWDAREGQDNPDLVLPRLVALLQSAVSATQPAQPVGWFARYFLGIGLLHLGQVKDAVAVWKTLESVPPPAQQTTQEIAYRIAETVQEPAPRAVAWRALVSACPAQPSDSNLSTLCLLAAYHWMAAEYALRSWRAAIEAAAQVLVRMDQLEDSPDLRVEATTVLVESLDRFGGEALATLPAIPNSSLRAIGEQVSRRAGERYDTAIAVQAWDSSHIGKVPLSPQIQPVGDRLLLMVRLHHLMASCALSNLRSGVEIRIQGDGRSQVKVEAIQKGTVLDAGFTRCIGSRAGWFFRDAPAGYKATVSLRVDW